MEYRASLSAYFLQPTFSTPLARESGEGGKNQERGETTGSRDRCWIFSLSSILTSSGPKFPALQELTDRSKIITKKPLGFALPAALG